MRFDITVRLKIGENVDESKIELPKHLKYEYSHE